jgi:hypothetical protein
MGRHVGNTTMGGLKKKKFLELQHHNPPSSFSFKCALIIIYCLCTFVILLWNGILCTSFKVSMTRILGMLLTVKFCSQKECKF